MGETHVVTALMRPRCRVPLGEPGECGQNWAGTPRLPGPAWRWLEDVPGPRTEVRALAGPRALCVRFDCALDDPARLAPQTPQEPLGKCEHVWVEVGPLNDPVERLQFRVDFKGSRDVAGRRCIPGEKSLEAVPDLWQAAAPSTVVGSDWHVYHGLAREAWWVEMVLPWRALGLTRVPATIALSYGRVFATGLAWPLLNHVVWPEPERASTCPRVLEPGEGLIGPDAGAPERLELAAPRFGKNTGRLALGKEWRRGPGVLRVRTEAGPGGAFVVEETAVRCDGDVVEFQYWLDRARSSHVDVFSPQRLVVEVCDADEGTVLYAARLPMGRHLGICVDEPYGEQNARQGRRAPRRDEWLDRVTRALPRLYRRTTAQGAPSDFCLMFEHGAVAADLMGDDAWQRLAALVEERFATAEERLVGAMALVGQKSVTNLILGPMFFKASGEPGYHNSLHEWMGPLSIMRYGGGPAVSRAAVLARLLQHVNSPDTGRPFVTRVVSLAKEGGPTQVTRRYVKGNAVSPFGQYPGRVGAVAVDCGHGQTLLDPTALAFFVLPDGKLATIERMVADESVRVDGAGRLAAVYAKVDPEEVRAQRPDRLLSKGVFPELCPDEDGVDRPCDPRERQVPRTFTPGGGAESALQEGLLDLFGQKGDRDGSVQVGWDEEGLRVCVHVRGVHMDSLEARDLAVERVHIAVDTAHGHTHFHHFLATAAGERRLWREHSSGIQRLFKHLATENHAEDEELIDPSWIARLEPRGDGYEALFQISWEALGIEECPPVMGLNAWVEGRTPYYEQVFLVPPRWQQPADPFSFADVYLTRSPAALREIDLGVLTWGRNTGRVVLANASPQDVRVTLQAENHLGMCRRITRSAEVPATVPAGGEIAVEFPFFVSPEEKMTSGSRQQVVLQVQHDGACIFRGSWNVTYCQPLSAYQRYGRAVAKAANPRPGDADFLDKKTRYICSRIPQFQRLTTRDGAASDFVLRAEDGSVEFNLMEAGVLDRMAEYVHALFDNDVDRILGICYLSHAPDVARHMSGGHRIMNGAGPLSVMRGNFAGGGGNCGYHSRVFAGMAAHLRIGGKPLTAHTVAIWGHCIAAVSHRGTQVLMDADVGHFMMTPDGTDLATIEEFRVNPSTLCTAGPGDIARYYTVNEARERAQPSISDHEFAGVFPPGAPKA